MIRQLCSRPGLIINTLLHAWHLAASVNLKTLTSAHICLLMNRYIPSGKDADYNGTELGPAHGQHGNGYNGHANGNTETKQSLA